MNLSDYINQTKNPPKKVEEKRKIKELNMNTFNNISTDKKNLIMEMYNYIPKRYYQDILYLYDKPSREYGYVRTKQNGVEGLVWIRIAHFRGSYDERTEPVPEDKFYKEYNRYEKVNSQKYTVKYLEEDKSTVDERIIYSYPIYFFEDRKVFMDEVTANFIANKSIDFIGKQLSEICIQIERQEEYLKSKKLIKK